jgi:hypothetical protein
MPRYTWGVVEKSFKSFIEQAIKAALKRDSFGPKRCRALALRLSMIFSKNRFRFFRIML